LDEEPQGGFNKSDCDDTVAIERDKENMPAMHWPLAFQGVPGVPGAPFFASTWQGGWKGEGATLHLQNRQSSLATVIATWRVLGSPLDSNGAT